MIGGMVSSTILTLVVIPVVYAMVKMAGLKTQQVSAIVTTRHGGEEVKDARY
jgi:hypothetical protein